MMTGEWKDLTGLTGEREFVVERIRLRESGIAIEGQFELPSIVKLTAEDQIFVAAFVRSHGSIKQMEKLFGVSYPTVKNRLNRIGKQLPFVEIKEETKGKSVLDQLEAGQITVEEALDMLSPSYRHPD